MPETLRACREADAKLKGRSGCQTCGCRMAPRWDYSAAQALVMTPGRFDVLVMENCLGNLLSDLGGGTVGGIGICPSGNIGDQHAYFEPIHGSAPSLAGKDHADPLGQILSAAMMLRYLGEVSSAEMIDQAVWDVLESGVIQIREDGCPADGCFDTAAVIASHLATAEGAGT